MSADPVAIFAGKRILRAGRILSALPVLMKLQSASMKLMRQPAVLGR